jgi:hypothetical protein
VEAAASSAASTSSRWLVKHGPNQPCAEAVGICISCLLGIVEAAQPVTLEPELIWSTADVYVRARGCCFELSSNSVQLIEIEEENPTTDLNGQDYKWLRAALSPVVLTSVVYGSIG